VTTEAAILIREIELAAFAVSEANTGRSLEAALKRQNAARKAMFEYTESLERTRFSVETRDHQRRF
jgi:hypothetical protein